LPGTTCWVFSILSGTTCWDIISGFRVRIEKMSHFFNSARNDMLGFFNSVWNDMLGWLADIISEFSGQD
ncbi:hypothetical protein QUF72_10995, partial [Desulfobacterales bacterium HSG2]|nr:hypothetical protein [Desulfobacterales bacterium HSG2]